MYHKNARFVRSEGLCLLCLSCACHCLIQSVNSAPLFQYWGFGGSEFTILPATAHYASSGACAPMKTRNVSRVALHSFIPFLLFTGFVAALCSVAASGWMLVSPRGHCSPFSHANKKYTSPEVPGGGGCVGHKPLPGHPPFRLGRRSPIPSPPSPFFPAQTWP